MSRKHSQKMLSERQFGQKKINNSLLDDYNNDSDKLLPREYYNFSSGYEEPINSVDYIG